MKLQKAGRTKDREWTEGGRGERRQKGVTAPILMLKNPSLTQVSAASARLMMGVLITQNNRVEFWARHCSRRKGPILT